ncbi:Fanconi anemia group A protein [Onychostoma macrolepis]|uniref:Fanconi anemia group A protein n=1 Tax=Onychostoma macrolepis TaxID=369639 RepID=UPI00272CDDCE|nr:Fanconi anemia group A protein [Onychostoma macrolepis]
MLSATSDAEVSARSASVASLLARRTIKRARDEETEKHLQESCVSLLLRHQNTSELLLEITSHGKIRSISCDGCAGLQRDTGVQTALLESELRRTAEQTGVPVGLLSARVLLENIEDLITQTDTNTQQVLLNAKQRTDVCALLQSAQALMSAGIFSPELLWQEYWKLQPVLEVVYHLHTHSILTLDFMLERDAAVSAWISGQLRALCASGEASPDDQQIQQILSTVVCVLVRRAFEDCAHKLSQTCCVMLDSMIWWLLDSLSDKGAETPAAGFWVQVFDVSVFAGCVTEETLQHFFTHTLMRVLTYRPVYKVSDVIAVQSDWSFAKTPPLLTALFCKVCVVFSVERVLSQLQQVLETHEVNWRHVLWCVSHLLIYHSQTQRCLTDLLSRLLSSAFDGYDVEKMITLLLLGRQASLEGPAVFPSYRDWFKLSFGGSSSYHAKSKKSTVFLLKFLSDLVPYEPPQYLKVHVMHPPFIAGKYRSLLQEYISLAKTRLRDLKVSLEDTGIFEVVNGSAGVLECPAQQDVEKAVTLFMTSSKIPATVIEASIFRRPYFQSRFLPALLSPRVLPVKSDARMMFIEALRKADKIPAALYTSYTESCQRGTYRPKEGVCKSSEDDHLLLLQDQFLHLRTMMSAGAADGDVRAQLSRISLTLKNVCADEETGSDVITLNRDSPDPAHAAVINLILQSFCLCLLDASKVNPPNRQGSWPSVFVTVLLGHRWLVSALTHRLWDLLQHQGGALSAAHVLGLAALQAELHYCRRSCPPLQLQGSSAAALPVSECLSDALLCSTRSHMALCLRFCVAVLSYGLCRANAQAEELHNFIPQRLYKKAQYVMARLVPETRAHMSDEQESDLGTDLTGGVRDSAVALWRSAPIRSLKERPQYQLSFSEWLSSELRVQRSRDALTDPERQEYEQWACEQYYLPMSQHDGGCEGDVTGLCAHIISAVLDRNTACRTGGSSPQHTDSCLPDLLSLLQALLYEVAITQQNTSEETSHFLWDVIDSRCTVTPDPDSTGHELTHQLTLQDISRILVLVPPALLLSVRTHRTGRTLDCQRMMKYISHVQRTACGDVGLLPFNLTAHFLKAVVSCGVSCDRPAEAVDACLSLFSTECPLLLLSAARWWTRLRPVLSSQWKRLTGRDALPDQLQMLEDSHRWSRRVCAGCVWPVPSAPSWLLAECVHTSLRRSDGEAEDVNTLITQLLETDRQVLLFLFVLSVMELICAHLNEQACLKRVRDVSVCLLAHLVDDSDWLLLFDWSGSDHRLPHFLSRVASQQTLRLMPLAFYSMLSGVEPEVLAAAARCPGFLYSAAASYRELSRLFLSGPQQHQQQQVLLQARSILMSSISLSSPDCVTPGQSRQLQSEYEQLDPEISAALRSFT